MGGGDNGGEQRQCGGGQWMGPLVGRGGRGCGRVVGRRHITWPKRSGKKVYVLGSVSKMIQCGWMMDVENNAHFVE